MVSFSTVSMYPTSSFTTQLVFLDIVADYSIVEGKIKKLKTSYYRFW